MSLCPNCHAALEASSHFCPACGTKLGAVPSEEGSLLGATLNGKYRVLEELGSGAMGTVYLGEHLSLKKQVALKVLHTDLQIGKEALVRFQQEGIAVGKFTHPGAIQIFDFDVEGEDTWYLAMEYVEGQTLKALIEEHGPLDALSAADIVEQILSVLAEAHANGIVHRDLKPENIMVTRSSGDEWMVKVLDFGLSKLLDQPLDRSMMTQAGRIMGTPMYMSPEQCSGKAVDHRSDLYSVGLVFYELLTGRKPFEGETATELLVKHVSEEAPSLIASNPGLAFPVDIDALLHRALEKEQDDRFQDADEMLDALEAVRFDRMGKSTRASVPTRPRAGAGGGRRRRRSQPVAAPSRAGLWIALIATAVVIAGGATAYFLLTGEAARPELARLSEYEAEQLTPEEARYVELLEETRAALRKRDYDAALGSVGDALALECSDSEALLLRGEIYSKRGDLDTADADYRDALGLDPNYAAAHAGLGWSAVERGDSVRATECFELALGSDPEYADALAGDGALQFARGDLESARELLQKAVDRAPDSARANQYLGHVLLSLGELDEATEAYVQAKRDDPTAWRAYAGLGEAYLGKQRYAEAEQQLLEAIRLKGDAVEPRATLATLLIQRGRHTDAAPHLLAALGREPDDARLHALNALVLEETSDDRISVIEELEKSRELGAEEFEIELLLGIELLRAEQPLEALEHFRSAIDLNGESPIAHADFGLALAKLGRYEAAVRALERSTEIDGERAFVHLSLGVLYRDFVGDETKALASLQRYVEVGGRDSRARRWITELGG